MTAIKTEGVSINIRIRFAWLPTYINGFGYTWLKHYEQHEFTVYGETWMLLWPTTKGSKL